jgi:opacity protein-like surface antigen
MVPVNNKVLTGLAALTLLDLSAEMASAQSWHGPYAGLQFGHRWGDLGLSTPAFNFFAPSDPGGIFTIPARSESYQADGIIGGVHVGYNFLIRPSWLIGIEADVTAAGGSATATAQFLSTDGVAAVRTSTAKLGLQGTIRGRVGYVAGPWLVFGTGGVAFARFNWSETIVVSPPAATSYTVAASNARTGLALGGGVEHALNSHLTVRVQYLYEDFGTATVPLAATLQTGNIAITAQKIVFGGSYRF